jgi:branched-chain amino acid transport system substrate-binding protein
MRLLHTVLGAAVLALAVPAAQAANVKVGVIMTYSGVNAEYGDQITRAMELYLKLNQKELRGHTIELIKRDSKNPGGAVAKTLAQELVTRDKVDILTGFVFSPNAIATAPIATQAKVPMLIMNAGTAWITTLSPYIARVSFSMWHAAHPMGGYAAKTLGCKTAAVGYTDYPPGKDSLEAFKMGFEAAGGKVSDEIPMGNPAQVPDFTPFMQRVKDNRPDCFYVFVPAGPHAAAMIKTYGDVGLRAAGVKLIGPLDIIQDTKLQSMGDPAVGLVTMGHYAADYDNPVNKAFVKAWHDAYGKDSTPDFMAAAGWDGMAAIVHLVKTLDGKIDADKAMQVLAGWKFNSPRGPIMIDPQTRDIVMNAHVQRVVKRGDRLAVEVLETIPAVKDPCKELKVGKCAQ